MGSGSRTKSAVAAFIVFAATAALLYFGDGLMPCWPLMWFAPLPVLLFALRRPWWQAGLVAAAAWMAGGLNLWGYLRVMHAPPAMWFADYGIGAMVFAAGFLLTRALEKRGAVWSAWAALPAVWVSFEYVRNLRLWPNGSAACIAYSQMNFLPFLQLASIAGPWGMGFVLLLVPTGLALAIHQWRSAHRRAMRVLGATVSVLGAVLIFGAARLAIPQPGPEVTAGLVASDTVEDVAAPGAATERLFREYAQHAEELARRGARVVVLPENLGGVIGRSQMAETDAIFQEAADRTGAVIVAGMNHTVSRELRHNEARIYLPGKPVRSYDKEHLLAPWETRIFAPGTSQTYFSAPRETARQRWGVAICKDMDFTEPSRIYGRAGVGLMLVPAWDFRVDGFWHGHMAVMRGVEDGFSLARSARRGLLTVSDDRGRIVAETSSNSAPFATLMAKVATGHNWTLFLVLGDWWSWCSIMLLAMALARFFLTPVPKPNQLISETSTV